MAKNEFRIGKKGITQGVIGEIKRRIEKEGEVKVRINKNLLSQGVERKDTAKMVAELCSAELVEVRGFTFILRKSGETPDDR